MEMPGLWTLLGPTRRLRCYKTVELANGPSGSHLLTLGALRALQALITGEPIQSVADFQEPRQAEGLRCHSHFAATIPPLFAPSKDWRFRRQPVLYPNLPHLDNGGPALSPGSEE